MFILEPITSHYGLCGMGLIINTKFKKKSFIAVKGCVRFEAKHLCYCYLFEFV